MPERERVAGMEPAVRELADVVQRERPQCVELPHAPEVEEDVAGEGALHEPEAGAEPETGDGEETARESRSPGQSGGRHLPAGERPGEGECAGAEHEGERHVERAPDREGQREPGPYERDRRGEGGGRASLAEAARDERPREQHDEGRCREPQPEPEPRLRGEPGDSEERRGGGRTDESPEGVRPHQGRPAHLRCRERDPVHRTAPGTGRLRMPSRATIAAPGRATATVTTKNRNPAEKARSAETPSAPRKLTKNDSRTARPLIVNGTSMTRKSSGPIT